MKGKNVLITGGTSEIGYLTALDLATMGARVFITSKDAQRGARAEKELRRAAGHDDVHFIAADPSRVKDARKLASAVAKRAPRLDALINTASGMYQERWVTAEGYEGSLAVNLLVPFALTESLLPALSATKNARVVNVLSNAYAMVKRDPFADIDATAGYVSMDVYARAKLLAVLWTFALARRVSDLGIAVNAANPAASFMPAFLATAPEAGDVTGTYFDDAETEGAAFMRRRHPTMRTLDVEDQERAWDLAASLVGRGSLADLAIARASNWP